MATTENTTEVTENDEETLDLEALIEELAEEDLIAVTTVSGEASKAKAGSGK